jgi:hypothetical protein
MSYTQDTTSSRSLRDKTRERFGHTGDRGQAGPGLNQPLNGLTPPDPTFGLAPMHEGNLGGQTLRGTERLRDSDSASRSHRATISPNTNPPTWAKNATPPPLGWAEVRP